MKRLGIWLATGVGIVAIGFAAALFFRQNTPQTYAESGTEEGGQWGRGIPVAISPEAMRESVRLYIRSCAICHHRNGVDLGKPRRILSMPEGQAFHIISFGSLGMPSFQKQLSTEERWHLVAYIRALERSEQVPFEQAASEIMKAAPAKAP